MQELKMTELVSLPSKGLLYSENHPFHNKEEVQIRLLTAVDEDLLTNRQYIRSGKLTEEIIKEVLMDKTLDVNSLLLGDRDAILIYSRIHFLGPSYQSMASCKYCGKSEQYEFDISNVPIQHLNVEPIEPFQNLFKYKTSNDNEIIFSLPTVKTTKDIENDIEMKKKVQKKHANYDSNKEENITTLYKHIIKSINGKTEYKDILNILKSMPMKESREFRKYIKDIAPSIEFCSDFYCINCGEQNEGVVLEFNSSFFWSDF